MPDKRKSTATSSRASASPAKRPSAPRGAGNRPAADERQRGHGETHDESPLESLGKAVSAPVLGAAEEDEGEKPA